MFGSVKRKNSESKWGLIKGKLQNQDDLILRVGTKDVDESGIGDGKVQVYNFASGKIEYASPSSPTPWVINYTVTPATPNITFALGLDQVRIFTLESNITGLDVTNAVPGGSYKVFMVQDAIGGRTLTGLDLKFTTENDVPILLSTQPGKVDLLQLEVIDQFNILIVPIYGFSLQGE